MSKAYISKNLKQKVLARSKKWCAYCLTQEKLSGQKLSFDHIIPESEGGLTSEDNLCLACTDCNTFKADKLIIYDVLTGQNVLLFNPNSQVWNEHFAWSEDGTIILAKTAVGRVTIEALQLNRAWLVETRVIWVEFGKHPP